MLVWHCHWLCCVSSGCMLKNAQQFKSLSVRVHQNKGLVVIIADNTKNHIESFNIF